MMDDNEIEKKLMHYFEQKDYDSYNDFLTKYLKVLFVEMIKKNNPHYKYKILIDLVMNGKINLSFFYYRLLERFWMAFKDYENKDLSYELYDIYSEIKENK